MVLMGVLFRLREASKIKLWTQYLSSKCTYALAIEMNWINNRV